MQNEISFIDKSSWPVGPWQSEPDKVNWVDPETNLDCMARRNSSGVWCGYVGVPENHPGYGKDYSVYSWDDEPTIDIIDKQINKISIHGGLTFAGPCEEGEPETGICHKSDREVYWFGFDCGHAYDYMPGILMDALNCKDLPIEVRNSLESMKRRKDYEIYRDLDYIKSEVTNLAKQLSEIKQ